MTKFKDVFALNEGYENRVKSVADEVSRRAKRSHEAGLDFDVDRLIKVHSQDHPEYKLGGSAWKDFHKDVKKAASPALTSINRSRASRSTGQARSENLKQFHQKLAHHISAAIGDTMPDGDPIDHLGPKVTKLAAEHGIKSSSGYGTVDHRYDDYSHHLDKAAKLNGYKGYHDQLASTWHDYHADMHYSAKVAVDSHDPSKHSPQDLERKKRDLESAESALRNNPWR